MKFEYEKTEIKAECVAYIRRDNTLFIKTDDGCSAFYKDATPCHYGNEIWDIDMKDAVHKFYSGDKITITF